MRKSGIVAVVLAVALAGSSSGQQQGGNLVQKPGPRAPEACDLSKVIPGWYCENCGKAMTDKLLAEHNKDKETKTHTVAKRKICERKYWESECHPEKNNFEKGLCCGKEMVEKVGYALTLNQCLNCSAINVDEKCRNMYCGGGKMRLECALQPHFPHTNAKLWKEKLKKAAEK